MAQQPSNKDKQTSKNQNRSVGNARKGSAPTKAQHRSKATLLTWGLVGIVILVVVGLVTYSLVGSDSTPTSGGNAYEAAPSSLVKDVTQIPESVYNTVGVTSSVVPVTPPVATTGQPPLTFTSSTGTELPGYFYLGAEYCPYCAAERWAVTAALGRFGTISGLGLTTSSATDVYANTPSFTFAKVTFSSQYFAFQGVEQFTNIPLTNGTAGYTPLQSLTKQEETLAKKYDTSDFIPGASAGSIPFMDIGNQFLTAGASFSPSILTGLSSQQIASGLSDPANPATQAIVATANYITASLCKVTNGQPGNVCNSKGVQTAAKAMKISF